MWSAVFYSIPFQEIFSHQLKLCWCTREIGFKTFYFIQSKFSVYKWKQALALQSSIVEYEIFLLVKMTCGAVYWRCLRWHIQRLKWNKNIPGLCGKEIEINRDGAVIQSPVTFHFQHNVLRTYGANVRENFWGKACYWLLYAQCMTRSTCKYGCYIVFKIHRYNLFYYDMYLLL